MLCEALSAKGYSIAGENSVRAARDAVCAQRFYIVLTDLRMPDGTGEQWLQPIRQHDPAFDQRVVFMTGDTIVLHRALLRERSGQPCLEKRFAADDAQRTMQALL